MSSSQAPKPPTVGQELGSSIGALSGGGAGSLYQIESGAGQQQAQLNTAMNINNAGSLYNAFTGMQQNAQTAATNSGNSFLNNQIGLETGDLKGIAGGLNKADPYMKQLSNTAQGNSFIGAGLDPTLSGIEGTQAGMGNGVNSTLSGLSTQLANSGNSPSLTGVNNFAQGNIGQMNSQTANMVNQANTQLNLGSSVSPEEQDQISQASRAADSSRGIFNSNASAFNEMLSEGNYGQTLLQQRESNAQGANTIGNAQLQNNFSNAYSSAMGGINAQQAALNSSANVYGQGLQTQLSALSGAANTQGTSLAAQFQRQNAGLAQLGNLAGIGAQNANTGLNFITGQSASGAALGTNFLGSGLNAMNAGQANQVPQYFNSLGLFSAAQQNADTAYNGSFAAQEQNAQASNSLLGAGIGAGASALGALGSSGALTGAISGIGAGLGALAAF
jgi:hypothetical protein